MYRQWCGKEIDNNCPNWCSIRKKLERSNQMAKDETELKHLPFLISFCGKYPQVYNSIARRLADEFGLGGAELTLLITYFVVKEREEGEADD